MRKARLISAFLFLFLSSTCAPTNVSTAPTVPLALDDISKMKVAELKEALLKGGLSRNGNKKVLVD